MKQGIEMSLLSKSPYDIFRFGYDLACGGEEGRLQLDIKPRERI